ncbi:MAG: cupin domain-containing protein [Chloroflexi bacterium]|nr:cupin domain-containing protein [Chloroflexota bacterium]
MTLTRSDIKASAEELEQFQQGLQHLSVSALWANQGPVSRSPGGSIEPRPRAVPHVWHWLDLRPQALRAAELVGTQQAERRVLQLKNPAFSDRSVTTNTLFAGIQIVMPGEVARAHRHTMAALRFIIESEGGYTNVDGEPVPMLPGDLVLTPNWAWHDHANDTGAPMIWLDGLDAPLVRMLEAAFQEDFPQERQALSAARGLSQIRYGAGALRPAGEPPAVRHSPLMHYAWADTQDALDRLAEVDEGSPYDGLIMEYTNPVDGGSVMPTIACFAQRLRPGERTAAHRHTSSTIYHVVHGNGYSIVGGHSLNWQDKDTFCVPNWTSHQHVNLSETEPAYLFSFSDTPVLRALDLLREEPVPGEWG